MVTGNHPPSKGQNIGRQCGLGYLRQYLEVLMICPWLLMHFKISEAFFSQIRDFVPALFLTPLPQRHA